jgi:hypothetical protein
MSDPRRWIEDPSTDEAVRAALEAGRAELPSEAQLAALWARLETSMGPDGGPDGGSSGGPEGGGAPSPAGPAGGAIAKGIVAVVTAVSLGAATWWALRDEPAPPRDPGADVSIAPSVASDASSPASDASSASIEPIVAPIVEPTVEAPAPSRPRRPRPTLENDPVAEAALVRRAQTALTADPATALALTDEHRRRFGAGSLEQEREVVAIEALTRLGRSDAARARMDAFTARWPRSAHRRRLEVIVGSPP